MRIDMRKAEGLKHYHKTAKAYLDGELVSFCVVADEEAGYVECYVKEDGKMKTESIETPDGWERQVVTERKHGTVKIVVKDKP